jgi:hypothetical protein
MISVEDAIVHVLKNSSALSLIEVPLMEVHNSVRIYLYKYSYLYECIYMYISTCIYIYINICMRIYVYINIFVYGSICVYVC